MGSALLATLTAFPQNARLVAPANSGVENTAAKIAIRLAAEFKQHEFSTATSQAPVTQNWSVDETPVSGKTSNYISSWKAFSSSLNSYGVSSGTSRPLQFNEDLNAVSFIMRAGPGYAASPTPANDAVSGVIVAMVSKDFGNTWDSTCMWNHNTNWGRFPQGAIVNTQGNTNIDNAHIVSMTAINSGGNWVGNAYSTKSLGSANYNNVTPVTSTFFPTLSPELGKNDFSIYDAQAMDDGKIVALGYVNNNPNGNTAALFGYRGARVVKGSFVSGSLVWTSDSIIPDVSFTSANARNVIARPRMVWSEDGQVGYVVHIGAAATATGSNKGFQPIISKTTNGGNSWSPITGIDFNAPTMSVVIDKVISTRTNSNLVIPFFDFGEGMGLTVDKDNKLHIASVIRGTFTSNQDSLGNTFLITHGDGEKYGFGHTPGFRPFLFDFAGDGSLAPGSEWKVTLIDSLSSESAGTDPVTDVNGYSSNPWVEFDGGKLGVESRIQLSRTPDGKYLVYTWTESDTAQTTNFFKWNELPNIKARLFDVTTQALHPMEINVSKPSNNPNILVNNNVSSRAYMNFSSPKCILAQTIPVGPAGPAIMLPMTTTRPGAIPLQSDITAVHRYMSALLNFGGLSGNDIGLPNGIAENALNSTTSSFLYPNPAKGNTSLSIDLKNNSKVEIAVYNMIGQLERKTIAEASQGPNTMDVDISGLSKGVYMVNVKIGNAVSTKKLIVE